jgi:hypothetical protein
MACPYSGKVSVSRDSTERKQVPSEERLAEIRRQAAGTPFGSPERNASSASPQAGYYGLPLLKPPQWRWEVPAYFFTGGAAGSAAVIAGIGELCRADRQLIRHARWVAALCGAVSPLLLIADLGRPSRFLNMMRVFKIRSPMSVGSWTLAVFSSAAAAALASDIAGEHTFRAPVVGIGSRVVAAVTGLPLASYTGVLLGATAIPVWAASAADLPIHFAASGLGAAVSLIELAGHESDRSLNRLGIGSALTETAIAVRSATQRNPALEAIKSGRAGWVSRTGALLSGPLPLALRLIAGNSGTRRSRRLRRLAAFSAIAGSMLTRYAWVAAGHTSAADPRVPMQLPTLGAPTA